MDRGIDLIEVEDEVEEDVGEATEKDGDHILFHLLLHLNEMNSFVQFLHYSPAFPCAYCSICDPTCIRSESLADPPNIASRYSQ